MKVIIIELIIVNNNIDEVLSLRVKYRGINLDTSATQQDWNSKTHN